MSLYIDKVIRYMKAANPDLEIEEIRVAFEFAEKFHKGQVRKSGDEYIIHPVEVAKILAEMKMDTEIVVAGLLHDVVEDTIASSNELKDKFGANVAKLVEGVTKLKNLPDGTQGEAENIRKMIVAMAKDVRVVIIKLADRLHNMRTLKYLDKERQKTIAEETLAIFAPLAHRLGMAKIKWELEDLSLSYLKPKIYEDLVKLVDERRVQRERYINDIKEKLREEVQKYNIDCEIAGRAKNYYSIYKKMYEKNKSFEEIYDLVAIRILVNTEAECYNILGIVHNLWKPVSGRFKDYVAVPKSNGYQSIHTTIFGPKGKFVEIQIRTKQMHGIAEDGIAAHWKYKENVRGENLEIYSWLKKILEWQKDTENPTEFIQTVTGDILSDEVFVFTPQGEVIELPAGATPIDFAFLIHTAIGYKCVGAKINNRIVPIDYKLQNGDKVEIITSKVAKGPSKDWIKIVVTGGAKAKIKKWFKDIEFDEKVKIGKTILEEELQSIHLKLKDVEKSDEVINFMNKHAIPSIDELLFRIGDKKISSHTLVEKLKGLSSHIDEEIDYKDINKEERKDKGNVNIVNIEGIDNIAFRLARCCTPCPGDEISGYITRGKGVVIHRVDCSNYKNLLITEPDRIINVWWNDKIDSSKLYKFTFILTLEDKMGILKKIINAISERKINIINMNTINLKEKTQKRSNVIITIEIKNKGQYDLLINHLKKIEEVIDVRRE